ncbi:HGGxSTG domain-containing protein [Lichenihabitans sp. Uapishka_5]|uniref:HGGxSTG domain-containing protein n=1 Tax=Lichenihabitans sp. Uapishka_5 TaxID=3037302 RepID=UPI0029E808A1|nr:HGGxSTG domain-containing protein [Lichenihabitans sp. Uapishka_5]MDX7953390.1 HGGxSTG domain-containing protein [Lichenihabitans sp. Uapishka_5]
MARMSSISRLVRQRIAEQDRQKREKVEGAIAAGPPARSGIRAEAWESFHRIGFFTCPGKADAVTCANEACRFGAACRRLQAIGLDGDGDALPRKKRPSCGAKTRDGTPCEMRVETGSPRCRLHGGLSTGPKSKVGRMRLSRLMAYRRDPDAVVKKALKGMD